MTARLLRWRTVSVIAEWAIRVLFAGWLAMLMIGALLPHDTASYPVAIVYAAVGAVVVELAGWGTRRVWARIRRTERPDRWREREARRG